jgi:hypothetical protein
MTRGEIFRMIGCSKPWTGILSGISSCTSRDSRPGNPSALYKKIGESYLNSREKQPLNQPQKQALFDSGIILFFIII